MSDPNLTGGGAGAWASPQDLVGTILADRYQVQKVIGDGGMGSVFLAQHITLRKRVALKVLHPELCRDQTHVDRFLQEARAASMIEHDNIVDIVDFGPVPGGSVFFAMEYLEGEDLAQVLRREGRMTWARAREFLLQIVRALRAAHGKGIIHRDLKPANAFVVKKSDGREVIKLLDFGIAKVTDSEGDKGLTRTGAVFGTAKYMAPEQACGETADQRTDVYAAAVVLYELLTGAVPYDGDNFMRVLSRHLTEPLTLPSTMAPDANIPAAVESIVVKALSKKREDRYQTMTEFEQAILAVDMHGHLRADMMYQGPPQGGQQGYGQQPDAPGHTMWMGQGGQQPGYDQAEPRGGTMMLDRSAAPPGGYGAPQQGSWPDSSHLGNAGPAGTLMLDGAAARDAMGARPGPPSGLSGGYGPPTNNPPGGGYGGYQGGPAPYDPRPATGHPPSHVQPGAYDGRPITGHPPGGYDGRPTTGQPPGAYRPGSNPPPGTRPPRPETNPPRDPTIAPGGDYSEFQEKKGKGGFIAMLAIGAVVAIGGGGLLAWTLVDDPEVTEAPTTAPAEVIQAHPKVPDPPPEEVKKAEPILEPEPEPEPEPEVKIDPDPPEVKVDPKPEVVKVDKPETKPDKPKPDKPDKPSDTRSGKDISHGFARAGKAAKSCGGLNGALPGQTVTVEATINTSGAILDAKAVGKDKSSPLGKCVAAAVKSKARFNKAVSPPLDTRQHSFKM